jgi:hypothetical protein
MAAAAPAHFLGLEAIDFSVCGDGGMGIWIGRELTIRNQRLRRQGCSLCRRGERDTACRKSKGEFQKVPAFHDISSSAIGGFEKKSFGAPR